MKPRKHRRFVEAARAFKDLREEISAGFAEADRSRLRLELLAYLGALLTEFQRALDAYREERQADPRGPAPPWLLPDAPMAGLREYRLKMFDMRQSHVDVEGNNEAIAGERRDLAAGSGPGCEMVDACDDMAWFLDKYLYVEILAESSGAPALPVESRLDLVDEAARARMPEARRDRTLARMRDFASDGHATPEDLWRLTKSTLRRRERIDGVLAESMDAYKEAAHAVIPGLVENASWAFENEHEPSRILAEAENVDNPENRLRMKRWCTVQIVLDTIAEWATKIRRGIDSAPAQASAVTREPEPCSSDPRAAQG